MKIKYLLVAGSLLFLQSCKEYLDVAPKDQQTQEQLFSSKGGFYMATNGIYNGLSSNELYGRSLSYELIEVMAKRYVVSPSNLALTDASNYSYSSANLNPRINAVWQKAYELIMSCNVLIKNANEQNGLLTENEKNVLLGEMYATRAFLHLDMLRLFGPRWDNNPNTLTIPYNDSPVAAVHSLLPYEQVIQKLESDMNEAERLLSADPIITKGPMASFAENESTQLRFRQFRFNYYAVKALKARFYLHIGNKEKALIAAKEVINDPKVNQHFPSVDPNKLLANNTNPDRVFSTEVLMGCYVKDRDNAYSRYFNPESAGINFLQPYEAFVSSRLFVPAFGLLGSFENTDYRYQTQWEVAPTGAKGHVFKKYKQITQPISTDGSAEYYYSRMIPLIKLSEMYYIAMECESTVSAQLAWFDAIRSKRGIAQNPTIGIYMSIPTYYEAYFTYVLENEIMREFWGEGQIFYFLKRRKVDQAYENGQILGYAYYSDAAYQLPLPDGEIK